MQAHIFYFQFTCLATQDFWFRCHYVYPFTVPTVRGGFTNRNKILGAQEKENSLTREAPQPENGQAAHSETLLLHFTCLLK